MAFSIGNKVQAVDELGRWEAGKVKDVRPDGTYLVSFDGWGPDFDRNVSTDELRVPLVPFVVEQGEFVQKCYSMMVKE